MLANTLDTLKKSLAHPVPAQAFLRGARRHDALAAFDSPAAVLSALGAGSPSTVEERDRILLALLAELHASGDAVCQNLLILAFEPLLVRIRARLGRPIAVRFGRSRAEDLDQRVLLAFVQAAKSLRITSHAARALRLAVQRTVFEEEKRERLAFQPDELDEDVHGADPFEISTRERAAANEVVGLTELEGGPELRDMMLATLAHEEPLRAYVARTYPDRSITERRTIERRLTTAARRMEQTLRERARRPNHKRPEKAA